MRRSTALARAEAQLASRRPSARAPRGSAEEGSGRASAPEHGQSAPPPNKAGPSSTVGNPLPAGRAETHGTRSPRAHLPLGFPSSPLEVPEIRMGVDPPPPRRRFLKQRRQLREDAPEAAAAGRARDARGSAGAVLQKLAQLESRIRGRSAAAGEAEGGARGPPGQEPPCSEGTLHGSPGKALSSAPHQSSLLWPSSPSLGGSPSPPTSLASSRRGSLPERSIIRSLDELFWEAGDTHKEASGGTGSSSSSDFKVNVLSLDHLAPSADSQQDAPEEGTAAQVDRQLSQKLGAVFQSPFRAPSGSLGQDATLEGDSPGPTEISEQLSSRAAMVSLSAEPILDSAEYSEDFDSLASSSAPGGTEGWFSSSRDPRSLSEASAPSDPPSSGHPPSTCRVAMEDAAVQTSTQSLPCPWLQTEAPAFAGGSPGPTLPIASCVVSLDAVEALTTYSPAVFALNDLLEQNLRLIRQFVEASRRLHSSIVASLEEECFHYHTLEEAKKYIALHRPPPLTVEQALQSLETQPQVF